MEGKRKKQARETKERIYEAAIRLFGQNGIEGTGIKDIVREAKVSTGTFYLYFSSKEEIIVEIYMKEDDFYAGLPALLTEKTALGRIKEYFLLSAEHVSRNGAEVLRQLYYPANTKIPLANEQRVNTKNVSELIRAAQEAGIITTDISAEALSEYLWITTSGILFDWCSQNGAYDLRAKNDTYIGYLLESFLIK